MIPTPMLSSPFPVFFESRRSDSSACFAVRVTVRWGETESAFVDSFHLGLALSARWNFAARSLS